MSWLEGRWKYCGVIGGTVNGFEEMWVAGRGVFLVRIIRKNKEFRVRVDGEWPESVVYPEYPDPVYPSAEAAKAAAESYAQQFSDWLREEPSHWEPQP